jgi:hypothetical protein
MPSAYTPPHAVQEQVPAVGWIFNKEHMTSVSSAPKGKEHYQSQSDTTDIIVLALVREIMQNAMDARDPNAIGPVVVKFTRKSLLWQLFEERFMRGLGPHMEAAKAAAKKNADISLLPEIDNDGEVQSLLVEDYNTTGLRGAIDEAYMEHEHQNFVSFWLRTGVSSKSNGAGGRHGLGKYTLWECSALKLIFGLTYRDDAPGLVGYGQASLYPHNIGRDQHSAYGMFGEVKDGYAYPIVGDAAASLERDAGFDRDGKKGASFLIPFLKDEVTYPALIREIIVQVYFQILNKQLVAYVGDLRIDHTNILTLAEGIEATRPLLPSIRAASLALASEGHEVFTVTAPEGCRAITKSLVDDETFERMRALFDQGKLVDVRVRVPLRRVRSAENPAPQVEWGEYRAVMIATEDGSRGTEVFTRGSVTVLQRPAVGGYAGIVMAHKVDILNKFLGDAEDVSHTRWSLNQVKQTERGWVNSFAETAMPCVKDFFKGLGSEIAGLNQPRKIENALTSIFYTTRNEPIENLPVKKIEKVAVPRDVPDLPPKAKPLYELTKTENGFRVHKNLGVPGDYGIKIETGYCGRNRKLAYNSADYVLGKGEVTLDAEGDVRFDVAPGSTLVIRHMAPGASLTVSGFDTNRQLVTKRSHFKLRD